MSPFSLTSTLFPNTRRLEGDAHEEARAPVGVVDIGSNSVRLVVYNGAMRAPTPLFNEKVLCGLGKSVGSTGMLGAEGIARAVGALRRFRAIARALKVRYLRAVATAAVRDAADGPDFISRAEDALGAPIEILSGEREAELAAHGILMGFENADGIAGDLGGGSLELIRMRGGKLSNAASLPLGVLRIADSSGGKPNKAAAIAQNEIAALDWIAGASSERFYAVGGTWRSLARLHMEQTGYPLHVMHHYTVRTSDAIAFCKSVRKARNVSQIPGIEAVSRARRDTLPYGAAVLEQALSAIRPKELVVSVFGIREGLIFGLLQASERLQDPLICFCEEYAALRSRSPGHGHELDAWMSPLFEAPGLSETPEQRRLRLAACLLSDIGWRAHPDYRGEQSLNVVAHAALTAIDHPGRLYLALAQYFRHEGYADSSATGLTERLRSLAGPEIIARARVVATAIRAAHMISCGMAGIICETPITVADGVLKLHLPRHHIAFDGERLRRRFQSLAQLLALGLEVRHEDR